MPPYPVTSHGLSHPAPNIDFFSQMAPPSCGKCLVNTLELGLKATLGFVATSYSCMNVACS